MSRDSSSEMRAAKERDGSWCIAWHDRGMRRNLMLRRLAMQDCGRQSVSKVK